MSCCVLQRLSAPSRHQHATALTGHQDLKTDLRAMSDVLNDMKRALDATNQRQSDPEARMTNLSGTVQRSLAEQHDDRKDLSDVKADVGAGSCTCALQRCC